MTTDAGKAAGPRERLIANAIAMVQERGVHATGLADLLRRSAAARNSIYQHFPGGKTELMVAVTQAAGASTARRIDTYAESAAPAEMVRAMIAMWVRALDAADYDTGCPIAAAALAGPDEPEITEAAAHAFALLRERIEVSLRRHPEIPGDPAALASFCVSAIEGGLLQARAQRSPQPLRDVEAELARRLAVTRPAG
nr:TetR/AcrR family transcriptional regulator [Mycolicibacterium palauense]